MRALLTLLLVFTLGYAGFGQSSRDFQKKYESGVTAFKRGEMEKAKIILSNLADNDHRRNKYIRESMYLVGLIDFRQERLKAAYQVLITLLNQYADWDRAEEAYYLLANIEFINGDVDAGLLNLRNLNSKNLEIEGFKMKTHYFLRIESTDSLQNLLDRFPEEEALAQVLAQRLTEKQFVTQQDRMLLEYLMQTFVLDKALESRISELSHPQLKDEYHVALLLPFNYEVLKKDIHSGNPTNHFAVDIYNGISLALDSLNKLYDTSLVVHCYDTKHDTTEVHKLLATPELKQMDLFIGPIYKEENILVSSFCHKYMIGKLNLLSTIPLKEDSVCGFYYKTSIRQLAIEMARMCYDSVATDSILLVANNYDKDSLFVREFMREFDTLGGSEVTVKVFDKYATMHLKLTEMHADSSIYKGIVVANGKKNTISNICSFYTVHNLSKPLVVNEDWPESEQFLAASVRRAPVYFVNHNFASDTADFNMDDQYLNQFGIPENEFSIIGYDAMMVFGRYLTKYGSQFYYYIKQKDEDMEYNYRKFNYYQSNSNNYIPTTKYFRNQFTTVK